MDYSSLRLIGIGLFLIFICTLFIGSIILFIRAHQNSKELEKTDFYGYSLALFFLSVAIAYIIRFYFMFFLAQTEQEFLMQMRAQHRLPESLPAYAEDGRLFILQYLWQLHMASVLIGIGFLMFATEYKIYTKTKYFFTILTFAVMVILIVFPYEIAHQLFYISYISPLAWMLIYINLARKSVGDIRKNAVMLFLGFILFIIGIIFNSGTARYLLSLLFGLSIHEILTVIVAPIMLTIGFVIILLAMLNKF